MSVPPPSPRTKRAKSSGSAFSVFTAHRNLKFIGGISPIAIKYMRMRQKTKRFREKTKDVDREEYYLKKNSMWDGLHEDSARDVRRLFERMGGMYNKLAQDWATRDGLLPKAWCRELQGTFNHFEPRSWAVIEKVLLEGLADLPGSADRTIHSYYTHVEEKALAAASIGQVHIARMLDGRECVVKIIYPDIRKSLNSDLANARYVSKQIVRIINLPMKDTVDVIMDEFCKNFPQELDFMNEVRYLKKAREIIARRGLPVYAPEPYEELCTTSVLTQELLQATTISNLLSGEPTPEDKERAYKAAMAVAETLGVMMFEEKFFHADPHPGNVMLLDDGRVGLIDFGQCVELEDEALRMLCHIVMLLRTRNKVLITEAVNSQPEFGFNTSDRELQLALIHFFFDTSASGGGLVAPSALETLEDMMQHNPKAMPILTNVPSELVFYGRVCTTLRKSFSFVGRDISVIEMWYPSARRALLKINAAKTDRLSSMLLMMPEDPRGVVVAMNLAQRESRRAVEKLGEAALLFNDSSSFEDLRSIFSEERNLDFVINELQTSQSLIRSFGLLLTLAGAALACLSAAATDGSRVASKIEKQEEGAPGAARRLAHRVTSTVAYGLTFVGVFAYAFVSATFASARAFGRVARDLRKEPVDAPPPTRDAPS